MTDGKRARNSPAILVAVASVVIGAGIFIVDILMPLGVAAGVPYVGLVLISLYFPWRHYAVFLAIVATVLIVIGYFLSSPLGISWVVITNRLLAVLVVWMTAEFCRRRLQVEEALIESEGRYRALVESNPYGFEVIDVNGIILYSNSAYQKMVGYTEEELLGKSTLDLLDTDEARNKLKAYLPILVKDQLEPATYEQKNRTKDGRIIDQQVDWNYRRDSKGCVIGFSSVITDITETKRLQELESRAARLETAGTIAGQVAHDFNNLLGPLMACPGFIREELPSDHPALQYLDMIEQASQRIAEINQDLLAMGRRGHHNQEVLNLNTVVQHALAELEPYPKTLVCEIDLSDDLMDILGVDAQLHRLISNLLHNSLDAMQGIGQVTVRTQNYYVDDVSLVYSRVPKGEYVKLTISDTGCGIPDDIVQKIFDPFFSSKTTDKKRGSGLGLSVVDAVIKDHNGYFDLSTKVGEGTAFHIYFPITRELMDSQNPAETCRGSESILIVDDDDIQREVSSQLLTRMGYSVCSVESGEKAVEFLRENPRDLVILDMIMPGGIDGTETYRRILEISPQQKAIILSGFSESDKVFEVQKLGAGAFVKKPITQRAIAAAVRTELDRQAKVMS